MERLCTTCGETKASSEFYTGYKTRCKTCSKRYGKKYQKTIVANRNGWYKYLLYEQQNKCAICGLDQCEISRRFAVDHDHETTKIRGLLCSSCNTGLGFFKDSVDILLKAIDYLNKEKT